MRIASVAFRGIWILKISALGIVLWQGKGLELRHLCRDSSQGSLCAKMNIARSPIKTSWSTSTKAVTWLSACSWRKGRGKYIRRIRTEVTPDDAWWRVMTRHNLQFPVQICHIWVGMDWDTTWLERNQVINLRMDSTSWSIGKTGAQSQAGKLVRFQSFELVQ